MTAVTAVFPQPSEWRRRIDARDQRICSLYLGGKSMDEVGKAVGLGRPRVHRILHRYNVPIRQRGQRLIMSAYGPAQVLEPTLDVLADILGFGVPALGLSDFELHGASMYQRSPHVCARGQAHLRSAVAIQNHQPETGGTP